MKKIIRNKIYLILILSLIIFFIFFYKKQYIKQYPEIKENELSIIINMKYLNKEKHLSFYNVMKELNSSNNYYFIKNIGNNLNESLNELVDNSTIKLVQSNFPDSIYLPLIVSLYGNNIPDFILFIEDEDINNIYIHNLIQWYNIAYKYIIDYNYDYIFGNSQIIEGKEIGCSILFSKASIIQHLLYYTDSDTTHINPFIQLSLSTETKYKIIPFNNIKISNIENIHGKFSLNMNCPSINDNLIPSICTILPVYKRNYFSDSLPAYSNQTYKSKFFIILQNDNRIHFNLSLIQSMLDAPVYHIWMQNWNSFFFLNHRLSSVFPCDFVMKYDDDQWPNNNTIQEELINKTKNKNVIIGGRGIAISQSYCGLRPKSYKNIEHGIVDHSATPFLIRTGYFKLDARNKIFRLYHGEDMSLSLNSWKECNVTSKIIKMNLIERHNDGKNREASRVFKSLYKKEKERNFNIFKNTYGYLIRSGYMPRRWVGFNLSEKEYINISIKHKRIN